MTERPTLDYVTPTRRVKLRRSLFWAFTVCAVARVVAVSCLVYLVIYFGRLRPNGTRDE